MCSYARWGQLAHRCRSSGSTRRSIALNLKLRIRNHPASETAQQKPACSRNCTSEASTPQKPTHQKPARIRNWRLARELGSNAGVVRRKHPSPHHDSGMVQCVLARYKRVLSPERPWPNHDNIHGLMHSDKQQESIHGAGWGGWGAGHDNVHVSCILSTKHPGPSHDNVHGQMRSDERASIGGGGLLRSDKKASMHQP